MLILSENDINPYIRNAYKQEDQDDKTPYRVIYDYEFIYCHSNSLTIDYISYKINVPKGNIVIIPPSKKHKIITNNCEAYWVHFDFIHYKNQLELAEFIKKNSLNSTVKISNNLIRPEVVFFPNFKLPNLYEVKNSLDTKNIFLNLINLYSNKRKHWQLKCKQLLIRLILEALENLEKEEFILKDDVTLIQNVKKYIENNVHRKITSKELAIQFHYHYDTLNKLFKKQTNITILNYILDCKINYAKKLLEFTDLSVDNIAELCGYNERTYFSKVFKKKSGISPSKYKSNSDIES